MTDDNSNPAAVPADPANAAQASAAAAIASEASAKQWSEQAKQAAAQAEAAANDTLGPTRVAKLSVAVAFFTLIAIAVQGFLMWRTMELSKDSVELTRDSVQLTRDSLDLAAKQASGAMLQQLRADNELMQSKIYDPNGILAQLSDMDPNCTIEPSLSRSDKLSLDQLINQILAHYERYYLITSALSLRKDWKFICQGAKDLRADFCRIDHALGARLESTAADFKEAMQTCELPAFAEQ